MVANPVLIFVPLAALGVFIIAKRQGKSTGQALRDAIVLIVGLFAAFIVLDMFIE